MKFLSIFSFFIFITINCFSQDINAILKEADKLEIEADEKAAFIKFKEVLKIQPTNLHALVKCAELCSNIGNRETNSKTRDEYYKVALIYAKTAYKLHPENDDANIAMAIALGRIILLKSGKEKIVYVKELKGYAEKATTVNPKNFRAWHILGKWHYEVSNLSAFERTAAKIVYGALPASSFASSIACYEKAKALSSNFALNYLELAKAYKHNGEKVKAIAQLNYLLTLPNKVQDDERIKAEARGLLKKWGVR
jgi:tetratricopeptide (TPR) repeat protein